MFHHYIAVGPVYCSGSGSIEQVSRVFLEGQEVMVAVEQVVEAKEWGESYIRASTRDEVHSTKDMVEHKDEMNE